MTKSEFVDQVADRAGLSKKDAGDAVDAMLETIEGALKRGSDVVFSGFGKFSVSDVFVNGIQVLKDGNHTGATPGKAVFGAGYKESNP